MVVRTRILKAAVLGLVIVMMVAVPGIAQQPAAAPAGAPAAAAAAAPMKQEELDQLLAPLALYPDSLLSQVFMASTYPLEIVEADRWVKANTSLKGDALAAELEKQKWDPSVKSLVNFPDILSMMSEKLEMTTKLGDAFIADQKRVMDSVQKLRAKAKDAGNLKTTEQMVVKTEPAPAGSSSPQVIVIESPSPQIVYVPTYDPVVVYGSWPYPAYPPYPYYPPRPPGWVAGTAIGFGVGFAAGAAWGYAWGGCNWGRGDVDIDIDRNVNINNTHIDRTKYQNEFNRANVQGGKGTFQHDPSHRQGVAYRDKATQQKFGGQRATQTAAARNEFRGRAEAGRQDIARGGASEFQNRAGAGAAQNRAGAGAGVQDRAGTAQNRAGAGGGGVQNRANTTGTRSSAFEGVNRPQSNVSANSARGAASRNTSGISGQSRPSGGLSRPAGGGGMSRPSGGARGGGGRR